MRWTYSETFRTSSSRPGPRLESLIKETRAAAGGNSAAELENALVPPPIAPDEQPPPSLYARYREVFRDRGESDLVTEVERIERYHLEHDQGLDRIYSSPLFKERSVFIPGAST